MLGLDVGHVGHVGHTRHKQPPVPTLMEGGSVTLIFRQLEKRWSDEHALNIIAAVATNSNFSHVEIAIGDEAGDGGQMNNVLRIFNDAASPPHHRTSSLSRPTRERVGPCRGLAKASIATPSTAPQVGVELAQRTGKSPNFQYLQLGCSKQAECAMLRFAYEQRGKPFSMWAMVRSVLWPRKTNLSSYFCAGKA